MRISDWSSDVCSSDLLAAYNDDGLAGAKADDRVPDADLAPRIRLFDLTRHTRFTLLLAPQTEAEREAAEAFAATVAKRWPQVKLVTVLPKGSDASIREDVFVDTRSEEHTSELQSLMRNSYAVFCFKQKNKKIIHTKTDSKTHTPQT